jgi:hypothetical protein
VAQAQGVPAVRVCVLRPLEEPFGRVVRDVDLREPDEEPDLPAPSGPDEHVHDLGELIGEAPVRSVERYSHSIVPGGLLVTS